MIISIAQSKMICTCKLPKIRCWVKHKIMLINKPKKNKLEMIMMMYMVCKKIMIKKQPKKDKEDKK